MGTIIGRTRSHASSVSSVLLSQIHSKLVQVAPFVIRIVQTQSSFSFPAQKVKVSRQSKLAASENVIGMRWLMIYVNMLHTAICSTYVCSMSNWTAERLANLQVHCIRLFTKIIINHTWRNVRLTLWIPTQVVHICIRTQRNHIVDDYAYKSEETVCLLDDFVIPLRPMTSHTILLVVVLFTLSLSHSLIRARLCSPSPSSTLVSIRRTMHIISSHSAWVFPNSPWMHYLALDDKPIRLPLQLHRWSTWLDI